jgi:hypothetical protein
LGEVQIVVGEIGVGMTSQEYQELPEEVKGELFFLFMDRFEIFNKQEFAEHTKQCEGCFNYLNEQFASFLDEYVVLKDVNLQHMMKASLN